MSEQPIKKAIVGAVNASGVAYVWVTPSGGVRARGGFVQLAPEGTPDVTGFMIRDGRFVGIEVKDPKGTTKKSRAEKQAEVRERIRANGGIAFQCTNVVDALAALLEEARKART